MSKYPEKFTASHKVAAAKNGFTNPKISTFGAHAQNSRIELDYETDGELYTVTWQLEGPGGFAGASLFNGRGAATHNDYIRDGQGNACHNFASFPDFLEIAVKDIQRREKSRKEAIARHQSDNVSQFAV